MQSTGRNLGSVLSLPTESLKFKETDWYFPSVWLIPSNTMPRHRLPDRVLRRSVFACWSSETMRLQYRAQLAVEADWTERKAFRPENTFRVDDSKQVALGFHIQRISLFSWKVLVASLSDSLMPSVKLPMQLFATCVQCRTIEA